MTAASISAALMCLALAAAPSTAQHTLAVAYNTSGDISVHPYGSFSLTYDGFPLILAGWPFASSFTYANGTQPDWTMMRTPLNRTFTHSNLTYLASYHWGSLLVQHLPSTPLSLDMQVTVTNTLPAGITGGAFGVHSDLAYWAPNASELVVPHAATGIGYACEMCWPPNCGDIALCSASAPQGIPIDFQSGAAAWVVLDAPPPLPRPITPSDGPRLTVEVHSPDKQLPGSRYTLLASLQGVLPSQATVTARFSLRFGNGSGLAPQPPDAAGPLALVADIYAAFGKARPMTTPPLTGGPLGALFGSNCGASCTCKSWSPEDCPNPRGWNQEIAGSMQVNTTSPEGVAAFQDKARQWVNKSVSYCLQGMGPGPATCSGILFWAIEGSQYYQPDPVYIGSPDMLPILAPEMDAIADELVAMVTGAGLKVGFTLRPQKLTQAPGWNASQPPWFRPQRWHQHDFLLPDNSTDVQGYASCLIAKVTYAKARWGASMFYVDTTVNSAGVLPFEVWDLVAAAHPDVIFFPEESEVNYFAVTAPLQDNWESYAIPVNPAVKAIWPGAYSLQLMQFPINYTKGSFEQWVEVVKGGDSLLIRPWYNGTDNWKVKSIYEAARG